MPRISALLLALGTLSLLFGLGTEGSRTSTFASNTLGDNGKHRRQLLLNRRGFDSVSFDFSAKALCGKEVESLCKNNFRESRFLCLSKHLEDSSENFNETMFSAHCRAQIRTFKKAMYRNISMDHRMQKACKSFIKACEKQYPTPETGLILACLKWNRAYVDWNMTKECSAEVFRAQMDASRDFWMDPLLSSHCSADAAKLCRNVKPVDGRVQQCLRSQDALLSDKCQNELLSQEQDCSEDWRLDAPLHRVCFQDQQRLCAGVASGDSQVEDCLEDHLFGASLSPACQSNLERRVQRRFSDSSLDPALKRLCTWEMDMVCENEQMDEPAGLIQCLQTYRDAIGPDCGVAVDRATIRASEDIRFDAVLFKNCWKYRTTVCKDVPDGRGLAFWCLQQNLSKLGEECQTTVVNMEVRFSANVRFLYSLKTACSQELKGLCRNVPHETGASIKCLIQSLQEPAMGEDCRKEVHLHLLRTAEDYRMQPLLRAACEHNISNSSVSCDSIFVPPNWPTCGGGFLKWLSLNREDLSSDCREEIWTPSAKRTVPCPA